VSEERAEPKKSGTGAVIAAALVLLPMFYVLSIGPVAFIADKLKVEVSAVRPFYAPVIWLHDHTFLRRPLEWYLELFGVK
jgi:hypothetical protein